MKTTECRLDTCGCSFVLTFHLIAASLCSLRQSSLGNGAVVDMHCVVVSSREFTGVVIQCEGGMKDEFNSAFLPQLLAGT